jgi:DNA-binding transcriptional LysR family regulator
MLHSASFTEQKSFLWIYSFPGQATNIEELRVSESVAISLKRAAIILAEELDYARAAEKLHIVSAELIKPIYTLEAQLCFRIFKPRQKKVELTQEGQFLIKAFRESVALHDRIPSKDAEQNPNSGGIVCRLLGT